MPKDKESAETLLAWKKNPDGEIFWQTLRDMFAAGVHNLRAAVKSEEFYEASRYAAHIETLEEVLNLPEKILDEQAVEQNDEEATQ